MLMKHTLILTVIALIVALASFFAFPRNEPEPLPPPTQSAKTSNLLRVAYWNLPGFYLIHIADKLGYFKSEGLEIQSLDLLPGTLPLQLEFAAGKLDAIAVSNSMFYSLDLVRHGEFGLVTYDPTEASVVMATGTITSPTQLRGKRLGVNSGNEFFLYWMLNKNNLKKDDVTITTEDFTGLTEKFKKGKYDAIFVVAPISTQLIREGAGRVIYRAGEDLGLITAGIVFHDNLIANNPEAIRKFNRAYFRAYKFAEENHPEAIKMTADWLHLTELDAANIIDTQYFFPNLDENRHILRPGVGIKNLHANLNYMRLFLGGTSTAQSITDRVTDRFLP
jgi:NitT/TauT family transport system substrate-binding protein